MSSAPQPRAPTRQAEMSAESRQRILDAAAALFAERGYAKTSLVSIEQLAGISRGSILHHFGSKDRLLVAVVERNFRDWVANTLERISDSSGLTGLRAVHENHRNFITETPEASRRFYVLAFEALAGNDELAERYAAFQAELLDIARRIIRDGIRAGEIRKDVDVDSLARIIHAVYVGIGLQAQFEPGIDIASLYADLARVLETAVAPGGP